MPKALVILCVVGWVWTAVVGVYLLARLERSGKWTRL